MKVIEYFTFRFQDCNLKSICVQKNYYCGNSNKNLLPFLSDCTEIFPL